MEQKTKSGFSLYVNSKEAIQEAIVLKEKKRKYRMGLAIGIVVLLIAMFFVYRYRNYNHMRVVADVTKDLSDSANSFAYKNGTIHYSEDGISFLDGDGSVVWDKTYSFENPLATYCDDYVAVSSKNGNEVILLNEDGEANTFSVTYPIMDLEVSKQGVVAAILNGDEGNFVELYNSIGKRLASIKMTTNQNGYPLDMDLSEDGENIVVTSLKVDGVETISRVSFYNFGEIGQNKDDQLIGAFNIKDTVIPRISYLGGDSRVCAVGDNQIVFFDAGSTPEKDDTVKIKDSIKSISFSDSHLAIITEIAEKDSDDKYEAKVFSKSGKEVVSEGFASEYTYASLGSGELILYGSYHCSIMNFAGHMMYDQDFKNRIISVSTTGKSRRYLMTFEDQTQLISLR